MGPANSFVKLASPAIGSAAGHPLSPDREGESRQSRDLSLREPMPVIFSSPGTSTAGVTDSGGDPETISSVHHPNSCAHPRMDAALEFVHAGGEPGYLLAVATKSGPVRAGLHSGAGTKSPFNPGGTRPPPKFATSVNVWGLPPSFFTRMVLPWSVERYDGSFLQDGWPMTPPPPARRTLQRHRTRSATSRHLRGVAGARRVGCPGGSTSGASGWRGSCAPRRYRREPAEAPLHHYPGSDSPARPQSRDSFPVAQGTHRRATEWHDSKFVDCTCTPYRTCFNLDRTPLSRRRRRRA
jgi:hypothetical protein